MSQMRRGRKEEMHRISRGRRKIRDFRVLSTVKSLLRAMPGCLEFLSVFFLDEKQQKRFPMKTPEKIRKVKSLYIEQHVTFV